MKQPGAIPRGELLRPEGKRAEPAPEESDSERLRTTNLPTPQEDQSELMVFATLLVAGVAGAFFYWGVYELYQWGVSPEGWNSIMDTLNVDQSHPLRSG